MNPRNLKHGHTSGGKASQTYNSWKGMLRRCYRVNDAQWKYYGERGIQVCAQWRGEGGFEQFLKDMGERPKGKTLDRECNDGNYTPNNCRWATPLEQAHNRRPEKLKDKTGENNNNAKLDAVQVVKIRTLQGVAGLYAVARMFKVTPQNIRRIWLNQTWRIS